MAMRKRVWGLSAFPTVFALLLLFCWAYRFSSFASPVGLSPLHNGTPPVEGKKIPEKKPGPIYKDIEKTKNPPAIPIVDNFLLADHFNSTSDFPAIASWNRPPKTHVPEKTPLLIGFTRNWPLLQQCVLSYITAGWPPEDIYVVDNTGTMKSNFPPGKLSLQNPFHLNVDRLVRLFGIKVISTPTLLTFAQLQNFYIFTAQEKGWDYYFWGHMDVVVTSDEDLTLGSDKHLAHPKFESFYMRAVKAIRETQDPGYAAEQKGQWALRFFAYDWLALNNVTTFKTLGGWDTFVSFYLADCDMHERIRMADFKMDTTEAGWVFDVGRSIDINLLFRRKIDPKNPPKTLGELNDLPEDELGGSGFKELRKAIDVETEWKAYGDAYRNAWQVKQAGGQGEPFYRDPRGFAEAMEMAIANGVKTYQEKWGHNTCE
ncbi:hypothetical protein BP5796_09202 [Coleophoma crateriformis]|uniref:Uncharacterized protein n=1 Tax=Coleophoma crateriformis TaxID=565419 RepID=A0A3D8R3C1_9HELO|nr:hypothetical protein BP5796_09202 [Coleophoma crateriformis]